jgi:hypothetical protein
MILPPLAFARIGLSAKPVDWFLWGPNDTSLYGSGKTRAFRCAGLNPDGTPIPDDTDASIVFRDGDHIRPVCPYFELYEVTDKGDVRPVTPEMLDPTKVVWTVSLAHLKAYYRTFVEGDKVFGSVTVRGDHTGRTPVKGWSPSTGEPLVFKEAPIDMGSLEVIQPRKNRPYRVRFWPPKGLVYGPTNIHSRTTAFSNDDAPANERQDIVAILNPSAAWPNWPEDSERQYLVRLTMMDETKTSLGLVDDTSDGFIQCQIADGRSAQARIAVTPPYYAPDRRHLISCADGLKDREDRDEPLVPGSSEVPVNGDESDQWKAAAEELVIDILERAIETAEFMNLEALVDRYESRENPNHAHESDQPWKSGASDTFDVIKLGQETLEAFPLSEAARRKHRQFLSPDLLKRFIRQRPDLLKEILRPPVGTNQFYNRQMPPLQRGGDARPLHLTRRQYDLLIRWAKSIGVR